MPTRKLLGAKQQAVINEHLKRDSENPLKNASATVWELITRKTLAANELSKDPSWRRYPLAV